MGTVQYVSYAAVCDGCGAISPEPARSALEARAHAHNLGWRFPLMVTTSGKPSSTASDVCPACFPGWVPQKRGEGAGNRALTRDEHPELT